MIFGDAVESPSTTAAAEWIGGARRGEWWTVGSLVPNDHEAFLRVHAPPGGIEDWWAPHRDLFAIVASIGERHTASPDRAWFAVWEGHGFGTGGLRVAWRDPAPDEATRLAREAERSRAGAEAERRNTAIRAALSQVPRFELPHRRYYLMTGPVAAATDLKEPGRPTVWRHPDLWWPDDRRWFVATDVDFWSLYIGGSRDLITELARRVPTVAELVTLDRELEVED
jgi:hypothetical protein